MDKGAESVDVGDAGETVYKRDYTGSFTNPSDW